MAKRPVTFTEFCDRLGIKLEAGQRVYAAVAFDGVQPRDLTGEDRATARDIFGPIETVTPAQRRIVSVVFGARGGKTYLGALRGLHLAITADLSNLASGQEAKVWFVAPDKGLATEALNFARGAIEKVPSLKRLVVVDNTERIVIVRPDGARVAFEIKAASRMGTATRGRVILFAMLDEAAFFMDADHAVNDRQIFEAIAPRVMMGGQLLVPSSTWAEAGLLFEMHSAHWGVAGATSLAVYAPTRLMRSDPFILQQVEDAYARDPDNAAREFGAQFLSAATVTWLDPKQVDAAVARGAVLGLVAGHFRLPEQGDYVAAAGDLGMNRNSSAACAVHRPCDATTNEPEPLVIVADLLELRPTPDEPLRPTSVCSEIVAVVERHGAQSLVADQHYKETMREALDGAGLALRDAPHDTTEAWVTLRNLMRGGAIALPADPVLIGQLKAVRWKALTGGRISIQLPQTKDGRHGDVAQVVALAANDVWQRPADQRPRAMPEHGTVERDQMRDLERLDQWAADRRREREQEALMSEWEVAV